MSRLSVHAVKISVVIAVLNRRESLQRCLDSVIAQTYRDIELIVIDGGSDDGTVAVIEANAEHIAYWESEPDRGIAHAWNKALEHCSGDWVCFLGADDYLYNADVMQKVVETLRCVPVGCRVTYGSVALSNEQGVMYARAGRPWGRARRQLYTHMGLPHAGVFHHKSLFEDRGKFDESYRIALDYEFLLRELTEREAEFIPDVIIAVMSAGGISTKPENVLENLNEKRRAQRRNGIIVPRPYWYWLYAKGLVKLTLFRVLGAGAMMAAINGYRRVTGRMPR